MKVFRVVAVVLLVLVVSFPIFSAGEKAKKDEVVTFTYGGWAGVYGVVSSKINQWFGTADTAGIYSRFRQSFAAQVGAAKAVVEFEMDPTFGTDGSVSGAGVGTDLKGELQIRSAYIAFDKSLLSMVAGLATPDMPTGLVLADDAPIVQIAATLGGVVAKFIYVTSSQQDGVLLQNLLQFDLSFKAGGFTINPAVAYKYQKDTGDDFTGFIPQVGLKGSLGALSIDAQVALGFGEQATSGNEYSGYSAQMTLGYDFGKIKNKVFMNLVSGDDPDTAKNESWNNFTAADDAIFPCMTHLFYYGWYLDSMMGGGYADMMGNGKGALTWGYSISVALNDFSVYALGAYHITMNGSGDAYGTEVNIGVDWSIMKNLQINVGVDFFIQDSAVTAFDGVGTIFYLGTQINW